jgi:hypothetical protein
VYDGLDVFCDRSKPLETDIDILKAMVGRTDHFFVRMLGKETQFTFNLVREPALVDSKDHPGIQIADVFASSIARAWQRNFRTKADSTEKNWLAMTLDCHIDDCVWPDLDLVDLTSRSGFVNTLVLFELAERSVKKEDFFLGMPEFIAAAHAGFHEYRRRLGGGRRRRR